MTRSQGQAGAAAQHKPRGSGGRRPEPNVKASAPEPRCWQSGVASKDPPLVAEEAGPPASANPAKQKGWGELPAAERASRRAQLVEMGFSERTAQVALEESSWDVNKALDGLFNGMWADVDKDDYILPPSSHAIAHSIQKKSAVQAVPSAAGDSTTASGFSTPQMPVNMSPQQELSPASSGDDLTTALQPTLALPPGLEQMPLFIAAPPGLDCDNEPTPCTGVPTDVARKESNVSAAVQVSAVGLPASNASTGAVSVVPKRRLQKVQHSWECDEPSTQLSVEEETFVYVWSESKTETGWIYAESLICCSRAGWLPESMMQPLAPGRRWMRISTPCSATFPMQLQVEAGNMVLVDTSHDPVNGWVYAEQVGSATGRLSLQCMLGARGWVPIQCIKWADV